MDTVQEVLFVETEQHHCFLYSHTKEGWSRRDIREGSVHLSKLDVELSMESIYANLEQF